MTAVAQKILVVGGNGFLGSAVCKAAVSKGWQVSSISTTGTPYRTPKGHSPSWTSKVQWHTASALEPSSYAHLLPESTAVVHTLGTLLPGEYKSALRNNDPMALLSAFGRSWGLPGDSGNPLERTKKEDQSSYATINRDAAIQVLQTYLSSLPSSVPSPRAFVFISAENIFRPFVPEEYITTKREAELTIQQICDDSPLVRPVYLRPGFMYHPHIRPLSTPIATFISLSSTLNSSLSFATKPSSILRSLAPLIPPAESVANALEVPPMHVDHVAQAVIESVERNEVRGVVNSRGIRRLIGWDLDEGKTTTVHPVV